MCTYQALSSVANRQTSLAQHMDKSVLVLSSHTRGEQAGNSGQVTCQSQRFGGRGPFQPNSITQIGHL